MEYHLISGNNELVGRFKSKVPEINIIPDKRSLDIVEKVRKENDLMVIILDTSEDTAKTSNLLKLIHSNTAGKIVFFLVTPHPKEYKSLASEGVDDIYTPDLNIDDLINRAVFLSERANKPEYVHDNNYQWKKIPFWKRSMDILLSLIAIILLTPLFLLVVIAIRLESKGKVFYAAKRVGTGYKVFPFYKFRSMYMDADKRVDALMAKNQYGGNKDDKESEQADALGIAAPADDTMLMQDDDFLSETEYLRKKKDKEENAFFKMANDPRITKVGKIIRNTSIDELPQLFNILKGDMSIVGNRPLPLYEAELLTNNEWSQRFLAPAGLTGLWQVTTRGKGKKLSSDERKQLDIDYANNYNFWGDVMIILKTIPALLQEENV